VGSTHSGDRHIVPSLTQVCCRRSLRFPELFSARFDGLFSKEAVMYLKIIAATLAIAVMAGCNTMAGAGKDVKSVGDSLENSAEKHK
jgi:predicted small secreted protein